MFNSIKIKIAIFGIGVVIFSLIFTSWGLDDINGLLAHPARAILLLLLFAFFIILGVFIPLKGLIGSRLPIQEKAEDNMLIAFMGAMGVLLFLMISPFSDRQEWMQLSGGDALRYVGVFLFTLGAIFAIWTSIYMCKQWRINRQACKLIIDGPFRVVRHPRDFGSILMFISIPLVFLSSLGLLLAVISSVGLVERISREEKILRQQFKNEWYEYAHKTRCLIPWMNLS
ncbi:MAG: isoprenylcysteine carboxylmethyltransferase family protein [Pseudomonadota bacterium]